jgi:hypothetical protein
MRDVIRAIAKAQCVPESFVAYPALSHGAAAIGNSAEVKCYADGGAEPAILWTGVIADSGSGKTKVLEKLSYPFLVIDREYTATFKVEFAQYQRDVKTENASTAPIEKALLIGDSTMDAIFVMCSKNPHSLLFPEAEGKLFFSFDSFRKGKTDEANYCKLYDRVSFKVNRKRDSTITGVGGLNLAMLIQPGNFGKAIRENPGMKTSGLLARLNLCCPSIGEYRLVKQMDSTAYQNWDNAITEIINQRTADGTPVAVFLDGGAQALWDGYMVKYRNLARQTGGWLGGYYDRLHVTAIRLALQFYVFEGGAGAMNSSFVERGIAVAEFMKAENKRVVEMFSGGEESADEEAETILEKIRQHGGEATIRELRGISRYRHEGGTEILERKLREMVKNGILTVRIVTTSNGRAMEYFGIVVL